MFVDKETAVKIKNEIVEWIRLYFKANGKDCNAVVGISGGKDSAIVAALCCEALGKDRVIGVMMPCGEQKDISDSIAVSEYLGIKTRTINIGDSYSALINSFGANYLSGQALINIPPRLRMTTLYAVSASEHGRVANTCNLSEDYVGYSTKYGDSAGDFAPIASLTVDEVKQIGYALGLPKWIVDKTPSDGLCGKTDEDNLGFTYETLDKYIRLDDCEDEKIKAKIDDLHNKNMHKLHLMPKYRYTPLFFA